MVSLISSFAKTFVNPDVGDIIAPLFVNFPLVKFEGCEKGPVKYAFSPDINVTKKLPIHSCIILQH